MKFFRSFPALVTSVAVIISTTLLAYFAPFTNGISSYYERTVQGAFETIPIHSADGTCVLERYEKEHYFIGSPPLIMEPYGDISVACRFLSRESYPQTLESYKDFFDSKGWEYEPDFHHGKPEEPGDTRLDSFVKIGSEGRYMVRVTNLSQWVFEYSEKEDSEKEAWEAAIRESGAEKAMNLYVSFHPSDAKLSELRVVSIVDLAIKALIVTLFMRLLYVWLRKRDRSPGT